MNENTKALTSFFCAVAAGRHMSSTDAEQAAGHLDAILAAHRAEVAAVKNEYEAARDERDEAQERLSSARDAALEEAKEALRAKQEPVMWTEWDEAEELISALQSRPADAVPLCPGCGEEPAGLCFGCETIRTMTGADPEETVPVEKVREVLATWLVGGESCNRAFTIRGVANGLGIDLDATPERGASQCSNCEGVDPQSCGFCCAKATP